MQLQEAFHSQLASELLRKGEGLAKCILRRRGSVTYNWLFCAPLYPQIIRWWVVGSCNLNLFAIKAGRVVSRFSHLYISRRAQRY